jgi:hypothetical protein
MPARPAASVAPFVDAIILVPRPNRPAVWARVSPHGRGPAGTGHAGASVGRSHRSSRRRSSRWCAGTSGRCPRFCRKLDLSETAVRRWVGQAAGRGRTRRANDRGARGAAAVVGVMCSSL